MVEDLMREALGQIGVDASGEEDQGHAVLLRVSDGGGRVRDAWPERRDQNRQGPGGVPKSLGHETRRGFVPREVEGDTRAVHRLDERQHLAAGNSESVGSARADQRARDDVRAGARLGVGHQRPAFVGAA